jgi:dihydrofolate reductase
MVGDHASAMSREGAEFIEEAGRGAGALVTARRTFDLAHAWGGKHPMDVPMVVVTHRVPQEWVNREGSPFTFVTEGVPKAIDVAREIAGDKDIVVGAPSVTQECLQLGLLDAVHIDLAPVVLGRGIRLFDHLTTPVELLVTEASGNPHVTHITYQVIK